MTVTRREWLRALARLGVAAGVIGGAACLMDRSEGSCTVAPDCGECAALRGCRLPQAEIARRTQAGAGRSR